MSRMASAARARAAWIVPAICAALLLAAVLWERRTDSGVLADVEVLANVPLSLGFALVGALIVSRRPGNRLGLLYLGSATAMALTVFVYEYAYDGLVTHARHAARRAGGRLGVVLDLGARLRAAVHPRAADLSRRPVPLAPLALAGRRLRGHDRLPRRPRGVHARPVPQPPGGRQPARAGGRGAGAGGDRRGWVPARALRPRGRGHRPRGALAPVAAGRDRAPTALPPPARDGAVPGRHLRARRRRPRAGWPWAAWSCSRWCPPRSGSRSCAHRLYDIDVVLNRSLVYAGLTAAIIALYVALVWALGRPLAADAWAGAVAIGIIGALVLPLRTVAAAAGRPGDVRRPRGPVRRAVAVDRAAAGRRSAGRALRRRRRGRRRLAAAALRRGGDHRRRAGGARASPAAARCTSCRWTTRAAGSAGCCSRGATAGRSRLPRPAAAGRPRPPGRRRRLRRRASPTRCSASRARLVQAREEERRRLRRDLHDGLGPTLAGVALGLDLVAGPTRRRPGGGPGDARRAQGRDGDARSTTSAAWCTACGHRPSTSSASSARSGSRPTGWPLRCPGTRRSAWTPCPPLPAARAPRPRWRPTASPWRRSRNTVRHARRAHLLRPGRGRRRAAGRGRRRRHRASPRAPAPGSGCRAMRERAAEIGGVCTVAPDRGRRHPRARRPAPGPRHEPTTAVRILVADDHPLYRRGLAALLAAHEGWEVVAEEADGVGAVTAAHATPARRGGDGPAHARARRDRGDPAHRRDQPARRRAGADHVRRRRLGVRRHARRRPRLPAQGRRPGRDRAGGRGGRRRRGDLRPLGGRAGSSSSSPHRARAAPRSCSRS